jgi:CDP-diacylglycerol--glycerol-3-phosphate 3-phosphatidyltransferase
MTTPSNPAGRNNKVPTKSAPARTSSSLQRQAWLAAALLLCPLLATLFLCRPLGRLQPLTLLTLLPGLAVALYLQQQLVTHLGANHRYGEEDRPFPTLGAATWITLLRAAAIVALAGFLPLAVPPGHAWPPMLAWAPGLLYLAISLADLADGFVARRQHRETELGKLLDIETDAAGLLVALLLAVCLQRLPAPSLLVGLAYYGFLFGIWWRQQRQRPIIPLQSRPYSRIIAGIQMGLTAMALLPISNPAFTAVAALLVMTPLLAGFVRDWLVVSCRIDIDSNQETVLDRWAGRILTRYFPLALRLGMLAAGIAPLAANDWQQASPFWLAAQSLCCLLAAVGCMGRSAALLLALILGCNLTPFGSDLPVLVLFGLAVTLLLTGTGPLSLWAPEERILYRRSQDGSVTGSSNA